MGHIVARNLQFFLQLFGLENQPVKLLCYAHTMGRGKVLFTGLVECGCVIVCLFFCIGKKQPNFSHHTSKPARGRHTSTEMELMVPHPVRGFNRNKEYLTPTLFDKGCGGRLSRHAYSIPHRWAIVGNSILSFKYSESAVQLSGGSRACSWRERGYVRGSA